MHRHDSIDALRSHPIFNSFPDKLRGVLNEGGLFGERAGWHLPGFSTARWHIRSPSQGLPNGPGVGFFVTTFELNVPAGVDAMFSFEFTDTPAQQYRALLFVNGWQYGKVWFFVSLMEGTFDMMALLDSV